MQPALLNQLEDLAPLEGALEYRFSNPDLLLQALTHRSQAYEQATESGHRDEAAERFHNERLEFLGDAVIGLVVADALYEVHPDWNEGELTRARAQLVSRRNMAEVAQAAGLGAHLRLGKGEERSGGRRKTALLANAMEAVIAAIYVDSGNSLEPIRRFAVRYLLGQAEASLARDLVAGAALGDHKSALQEFLQASHTGTPVYFVESESGPDHRKRFQVEVRLKAAGGELGPALASGIGTTKKKAEQEAARRALEQLAAGDAEEEEE